MLKYFLYARKSSESEERQILSIEAQLTELKQFAKRENLSIVDYFTESKTAKEPGRPVFNAMISLIEQGKAQGILSWHPDRLARNSIDGGRIVYLIDIGKIKSLKFPTFWFEDTPQGKFMLNIAFGQSKYYVDNLSENTKRGIRQKLRRGEFPCLAPFGYFNNPRTRTIQIDPENSSYAKRLFELYETGVYSLDDLVQMTEEWGLKNRKEQKFARATVERILKNPLYYGVIKYDGEVFEGSHTPIINKDLFDKVQQVFIVRNKRKKRNGRFFTYRGFMRCEKCGCMITAQTQKGHNYYHCTRKKGYCKEPYIREEALSEQINSMFKEVFIDEQTKNFLLNELEKMQGHKSDINIEIEKALDKKLNELNIKLNRLLDTHLSGLLTKEEYKAKKKELLDEKLEIKADLNNLGDPSLDRFEQVKAFINQCNYAIKITLESNALEQVAFLKQAGLNHLLKDKVLSFVWQEPFSFVAEGNEKIQQLLSFRRREISSSHQRLSLGSFLDAPRHKQEVGWEQESWQSFCKVWGG